MRDTGTGIAPQHLSRVFERFYRAAPERAAQLEGSGLGLSLARGIVKAHGGKIWLESELGKGTTVWVQLPLAQEPLEESG